MSIAPRDGNHIPAELGTDPTGVAVPLQVWTDGTLKTKPILQQDLIDNQKYGYTDKIRGFVFGRRSASVQNVVVDLWDGPTERYVFPTA